MCRSGDTLQQLLAQILILEGTSRQIANPLADHDSIDRRHALQPCCEVHGLAHGTATTVEEAIVIAKRLTYPVLVRPSFVLGGRAMQIVFSEQELRDYFHHNAALEISAGRPVLVDKFLEDATEVDVDCITDCGQFSDPKQGTIVIGGMLEHIEFAGVHSGDATLVFPAQRTYLETMRQMKKSARAIAARLRIDGPFNIQFIAKNNAVKVIECNLRASRSFPFVSKVIGQNFIDIATRVIVDEPVEKIDKAVFEFNHVGVKASQFSFTRLDGADPTLGVEMASTGEVGCLGEDFYEAFLKSLISVGYRFPVRSILLSAGSIESKAELLPAAKALHRLGITFYATSGTARFLVDNDIPAVSVHWPLDKEAAVTAVDYIKEGKIDLVINIPKSAQVEELTNGYAIRRTAVDHNVPLVTNRQIAQRLAEALTRVRVEDLEIKPWSEYVNLG